MNGRLIHKSSITVLAVTGALIAVGVGYAAIPDAGGVIHACYNAGSNPTGQLRVIDTEAGGKCTKNEKALEISQQGPKGDTGLQGTIGLTGPTGPQGPAGGALAYAKVLPNGTIDASESSGIEIVRGTSGLADNQRLCLNYTDGPIINFQLTSAFVNGGGPVVMTGTNDPVELTTFCPDGDADLVVVPWKGQASFANTYYLTVFR